jgi:hypothetical protein
MDATDDTPAPAAADWADVLGAALELWRIDRDNFETLLPGEGGAGRPATGERIDAPRLAQMLRAVGLDPERVPDAYPDLVRRAENSCRRCGEASRCDREIAAGTAEANLGEFCPNAARIHALVAALTAGEARREG